MQDIETRWCCFLSLLLFGVLAYNLVALLKSLAAGVWIAAKWLLFLFLNLHVLQSAGIICLKAKRDLYNPSCL